MKITKEILEAGMSSRGGWSNKQLRVLCPGFKIQNNRGWKKRMIGTETSLDNVKRFIALKDSHLKRRQIRKAELLLFGDIPEDLSHKINLKMECRQSKDNG